MIMSGQGNSTVCTMFADSPWKCETITRLQMTISTLSLIGNIFVVVIIIVQRRYTLFAQRLIMYLAVKAALGMPFYMIGDAYIYGRSACIAQGFGLTFFQWSTIIWIYATTIELYMNAIYERSSEKMEILFHVVSWGLPFFISIYPIVGNTYGHAGPWCWIVSDWTWRFGIWYIPCCILIAFLFIIYIYIIIQIRRTTNSWVGHFDIITERKREYWKKHVRPLAVYPSLYLLVMAFPLIDRTWDVFHPNAASYPLRVLHAISGPLQGVLYAAVVGLDKETLRELLPARLKVALQCIGPRCCHSDSREADIMPIYVCPQNRMI